MKRHTYTPGPWHTDSSKSFYVFGPGHLAEQAGVEHGAFVCNASTQATARLIAAAPALLEALQRCLPWIGRLIVEGAHLNCVAPNDAIGAMQQAHAANKAATAALNGLGRALTLDGVRTDAGDGVLRVLARDPEA